MINWYDIEPTRSTIFPNSENFHLYIDKSQTLIWSDENAIHSTL